MIKNYSPKLHSATQGAKKFAQGPQKNSALYFEDQTFQIFRKTLKI